MSGSHRLDEEAAVAEAIAVSDAIEGAVVRQGVKRQRRSAEEKRRIVEATLVPGASIARVAREHGVNANQVFQWHYEYRKQASSVPNQAKAELLPVTLAVESNKPIKTEGVSTAAVS